MATRYTHSHCKRLATEFLRIADFLSYANHIMKSNKNPIFVLPT